MVGVGVRGSVAGMSVGRSVGTVPVGSCFDVGALAEGVVFPGIVGARIAPVTRPQAQAQNAKANNNTAKIHFFILFLTFFKEFAKDLFVKSLIHRPRERMAGAIKEDKLLL